MNITDTIEAAKEIYPEKTSSLDIAVRLSNQEKAVLKSFQSANESIMSYNGGKRTFTFEGGAGPFILAQADYFRDSLKERPGLYNSKTEIKYDTGSFEVSASWSPSPLQQGNQFVKGLGDYGREKKTSIVSTYNELMDYNFDFDTQRIVSQFLKFSRTGQGPSPVDLRNCGFKETKKQKKAYSFVNRLAVLYSVVEPTRRIYPGQRFVSRKNYQLPEFPFATTYAMTCKLMEREMLDFEDIFSTDANFGPFTKVAFSDCRTSRALLSRTLDITEKIADISDAYIDDCLREWDEGTLFKRNHEDDRMILKKCEVEKLLEHCYKPPKIIKLF